MQLRFREIIRRSRPFLLIAVIVTAFYWKLTLTKQYTFLESVDQANQVLPWLEFEVFSIRHGTIPLWDPYEWFGQSLIGEVQPGVTSPFTYILALAPLDKNGQIRFPWVHRWFVFIHLCAAWFAYLFLRDLKLPDRAAVTGAVLFATIGFYGNTDWPSMLAAAIWAPLVFLFLLRAVRGRAPIANSCLAGLFAGISWLCGHHAPALYLTITAGAALVWCLRKGPSPLLYRAKVAACFFGILGSISALQMLPAAEYGKLAVRWTATGPHEWNQPVTVPEHFNNGFNPTNLMHLFLQGGDRQFEPFTGAVALLLSALAVVTLFRRKPEIRLFTAIALAALIFSMPRNFFLYGALYTFVPLLEKARSPSMAMAIFHFAVVCLAAYGIEQLFELASANAIRVTAKVAAVFGGALFLLFFLADFLRPTVNSLYLSGDTRPAAFAFLALLFAALCFALLRRAIAIRTAAVLLCLILLSEQSNLAGFYWPHASEKERNIYLKNLTESDDLANFLRSHQPARAEFNVAEGTTGNWSMGDWFRLDIYNAFLPSMLASTNHLSWWPDRLARMYGVKYAISKKATRPGHQEVFTSRTGYKIYEYPDALPHTWTVHTIRGAANDNQAIDLVQNGAFDLAKEAVITGAQPKLETCGAADRVTTADFRAHTIRIDVEMACPGMVVVSDNYYPGWSASVDGAGAEIYKVDTVIRGVAVGKGRHTVTMNYRPGSVIAGFLLFLIGVGTTVWAARRRESDGPDLFDEPDYIAMSAAISSMPSQRF